MSGVELSGKREKRGETARRGVEAGTRLQLCYTGARRDGKGGRLQGEQVKINQRKESGRDV